MSYEEIASRVNYNPATGEFFWIDAPKRGSVKKGDRAGFFTQNGYRGIKLKGKIYLEHRLAWFIVFSSVPNEIDHINLNGVDNRIDNLREATKSQNQWNKGISKSNKSGHKGVSWNSRCKMWQVFARHNGKNKNLGMFDDIIAAANAYKDFVNENRGVFARTK